MYRSSGAARCDRTAVRARPVAGAWQPPRKHGRVRGRRGIRAALYAPSMGRTSSAPQVERFGDRALLFRAADQTTVHAVAHGPPCRRGRWPTRRRRARRSVAASHLRRHRPRGAGSAPLDRRRDRGGRAPATTPRRPSAGVTASSRSAMAAPTAPISTRLRTWPASPSRADRAPHRPRSYRPVSRLRSGLRVPGRPSARDRRPTPDLAADRDARRFRGAGRVVHGHLPREPSGWWRIIGRTPVVLFDPSAEPPTYLLPGDTVRFEAVSGADLPSAPHRPDDWAA